MWTEWRVKKIQNNLIKLHFERKKIFKGHTYLSQRKAKEKQRNDKKNQYAGYSEDVKRR